MKSIIISPHSFVDLITNSSSELFICDTKKSIDTVKEIVIELVNITNQKLKLKDCEEYSTSYVFTDMFQEPEIFQYNIPNTPEYHELKDLMGFNLEDTCEVYRYCREGEMEWERMNPAPKCPHYVYPNYPTDEELAPYRKEVDIYRPKKEQAMSVIYKPFHDLYRKTYNKCVKAYCKLNDIDFNDIKFEDSKPSQYPRFRVKTGKYVKFVEELDDAISWGYTTKKGDIILRSCGDNSVPYELFEDLEDILHAQRVHLG
jgi:hypothetical protein